MSVSDVTVSLRPLEQRHLAQTLTWRNDPELSRLLDRPNTVSPDEHARWFASLAGRDDTMFFAIEAGAETPRHVGNVWLAEIDRRNRKAEVRVMIGAADQLGAGIGSAALDVLARHAFAVLHLHRVYAYVLTLNPRARRAFEKAGFALEGTLRDDRWDGTRFNDVFLLGRINHEP